MISLKDCADLIVENHLAQIKLIKSEVEGQENIDAALKLLRKEEAYYSQQFVELRLSKRQKALDALHQFVFRRNRALYLIKPSIEETETGPRYFCEVQRCYEV